MVDADKNREAARAYLWCWLLFLGVICLAMWRGWKTGYGYRIVSGLQPHAAAPARPGSAQKQAEINGVLALNGVARTALIGKPVVFRRIPVLAVMGNKGFWVGSGLRYRMLVVGNLPNTPSAYMTLGGVRDGDLVDIAGVVTPFPPAAQAKGMFSLSESGARKLAAEQIYVLATDIKVLRD